MCYHTSGGLLPHLFTLAKRNELFEDVSQVYLRDATVLRAAGGIFSVALSVSESVGACLRSRYPNRPPGVTRRVAHFPEPAAKRAKGF